MLSRAKGYKWGRKSRVRLAKPAILKAGVNAFRDRRNKKRNMRRLWSVRMNAALEQMGISYSSFIGAQKKAGVELDRKVLSQIAQENPEVFKKIVSAIMKK